jgi:hypothetical protein
MPALTQSAKDYEQKELLKENIALENAMLERQKKLQDIAKAESETLSGRVGQAETIARMQERSRQQVEGTPIGEDIGSKMIQTGGPSLLQATKMQQELNVEERARRARLAAMERYSLENKLMPEAKIDMGGVTATVPFESAGERASSAYGSQYKALVPQVAGSYMAEGYDRDSAYRKASEDVRNHMTKAANSGKVVLSLANGSTISYSNEEAMKMWKDPKTPSTIKEQLIQIYGQPEGTSGSDWVKSRLVR